MNTPPSMTKSQATSIALASQMFFMVTVNLFPPTSFIVNAGSGVSGGHLSYFLYFI